MGIGFLVTILKIFSPYLRPLIMTEFIALLLLLCSAYCYSYMLIIVFVIYQIFAFLECSTLVLIKFQLLFIKGNYGYVNAITEILLYSSLIYEIFAMIYVIEPYRVFKAQTLGNFSSSDNLTTPLRPQNEEKIEDKNKFNKFEGKGVRIG